jgi:hypothetical protein
MDISGVLEQESYGPRTDEELHDTLARQDESGLERGPIEGEAEEDYVDPDDVAYNRPRGRSLAHNMSSSGSRGSRGSSANRGSRGGSGSRGSASNLQRKPGNPQPQQMRGDDYLNPSLLSSGVFLAN